MTKTEFNYIQTINTLTALDEKQKEKINEQIKALDLKEKRIGELSTDTYNMKTQITQLKNELSNYKAIAADDRNNLLHLRPYVEKAKELERDLKDADRRYDSMISIKDLAIARLEKENGELKMSNIDLNRKNVALQDELDDIEIIEDEDEVVHKEESLTETEEYGGLLNAESQLELYEMPKQTKKEIEAENIIKMVDGGAVTLQEVQQLVSEKDKPNISDEDRAIETIEKELSLNKGRIAENLLEQIKGIVFDKTKITFTATIKGSLKTLKLRRNYLSPTYSRIEP